MRFTLEVDLSAMTDRAATDELSRILRYWAGAVKQVSLAPGAGDTIYDSDYNEVGAWHVEE